MTGTGPRGSEVRRWALLLSMIGLAACGSPSSTTDRSTGRLAPAAAEEIGDDLWMVPVARDDRGCVQYRLHSNSRQTLHAVFYRTPLGAYSTNRAEAVCN